MAQKNYYLDYLKKSVYFPQSVYHKAKNKMVGKMLKNLPSGSSVLDAGCGIGNITGKYCRKYLVTGIDEQPSAIKYCQKHYKGKYLKTNLYKLPFENNKFDLILFLDVIEHLTKPKKVLKELARVLRPEAYILICTINYANPLWLVLENTWHRFFAGNCHTYSQQTHPTRYTTKLLQNHCQKYFKKTSLEKKVLNMELFYIGKKKTTKNNFF